MKKFLLSMILAVSAFGVISAAHADTTSSATSTSASNSGATNAGNNQAITFTSPERTTTRVEGTQTVKNVPSMVGPNLTTSNDTCMGSRAAGIAVAGFGAQGGSTYVEESCIDRVDARELWNMGMRLAAIDMLCATKPKVKAAIQRTGMDPMPPACRADTPVAEAPAAGPVKTAAAPAEPTVIRQVSTPAGWEGANMSDPYIARRAQQ